MKNRTVMVLMACVTSSAVCAQSEIGVATEPEFVAPEEYQEHLDNYEVRLNRGFTVMVHRDMIESEPELLEHVMLLMAHDLAVMEEVLPAPAFEAVRGVKLWVERQGAVVEGGMSGRGMCFHVSTDWLTSNGLLAEKTGGVEVVRAADYSVWRRSQPFMTFHEFTHAYHHLVGVDDPTIVTVFEDAMSAGLYDAVGRNSELEDVPAYAMTNHIEYFAELSEAYFGLNDFYPYTRKQLAEHDPAGLSMVEMIWGLNAQEIQQRVEAEGFPRDDRELQDTSDADPIEGDDG